MSDIFRDSFVGQVLRLVTNNRILQFPEEKDPSIYDRFINVEKSARLARTGSSVEPPEASRPPNRRIDSIGNDVEKKEPPANNTASTPISNSRRSSDTEVDPEKQQDAESLPKPPAEDSGSSSDTDSDPNALINTVSNTKVDPERGRDIHLVDWWGPEDPENPRNWSKPKKFWVTFEILLLTFSVYVGSAIYTAGIVDITQVFGVSRVAATLGLTLFVLGYATGPMLWSPMSEIPFIGRNPVYVSQTNLLLTAQNMIKH